MAAAPQSTHAIELGTPKLEEKDTSQTSSETQDSPDENTSKNETEADNAVALSTEEEAEPVVTLSTKELAIMCTATTLAIMLIALDETIIATAIPRITVQFHSLNDVGWYGSAYLLTICCFQLHYGKMYQHFDQKRVFLASILIFEVGSAVCGGSPNSASLIVGRAVAGSGAAGVIAGTLIIIAKSVPVRQRSIYMASIGAIYGVASLAGPLLGGVITDSYLTWRWCFYINLPIGGFVIATIAFLYRPPKEHKNEDLTVLQKLKLLDPIGFVLFVPSVVCLLLALQLSGGHDSWRDSRVIALLVLFGVFLISFVGSQIYLQEGATVPPRIALQRTVAFGSLFVFCNDGAYYVLAYYLPIWFQGIKGLSAAESGIHIVPLILGTFASNLIVGSLITLWGHYQPFVLAGTVITSIGCGLLTTLQITSGPSKWIGYQAMAGIGVGLGMQQGVVAVSNVLPIDDQPIGIAVIAFFQTLGPTLMISIASSVFDQRLSTDLAMDVHGINVGDVLSQGATNITTVVQPDQRHLALLDVNKALTQAIYCAVAVAAISGIGALGMEWKSVKKEVKND